MVAGLFSTAAPLVDLRKTFGFESCSGVPVRDGVAERDLDDRELADDDDFLKIPFGLENTLRIESGIIVRDKEEKME